MIEPTTGCGPSPFTLITGAAQQANVDGDVTHGEGRGIACRPEDGFDFSTIEDTAMAVASAFHMIKLQAIEACFATARAVAHPPVVIERHLPERTQHRADSMSTTDRASSDGCGCIVIMACTTWSGLVTEANPAKFRIRRCRKQGMATARKSSTDTVS